MRTGSENYTSITAAAACFGIRTSGQLYGLAVLILGSMCIVHHWIDDVFTVTVHKGIVYLRDMGMFKYEEFRNKLLQAAR